MTVGRWRGEELSALRRRYPHERTCDIAADIGRSYAATNTMAFKLGLKKTAIYMCEQIGRLTVGGRGHRFPPGHVPANKGLRRPGWYSGRMRETQFKNGHQRNDTREIGGFRLVKKEGHLFIKVSLTALPVQRRWLELHKFVWMQVHGDIPNGHVVRFTDRDASPTPDSVTVDRLECISKAENCRRNSIHNLPKPVVDVIQQRGRLTREINKQRRAHEEQHRRSA